MLLSHGGSLFDAVMLRAFELGLVRARFDPVAKVIVNGITA
jgi:hypothetical protein